MKLDINKIHNQECLKGLKLLPDESVDCIITSPPYYALRDYKVNGQIGLEKTPDLYCQKIVEVFRECRRVLKNQGTLWLNIGDSYAGSWGNYSPNSNTPLEGWTDERYDRRAYDDRTWRPPNSYKIEGLKTKDLIGIPWLVAFALRADGWWLRQDIIWNKPNPMPESITDRCTKSHEYIFLLSKSKRYYYDHVAIMTDISQTSINRLNQNIENQKGSDRVPNKTNGTMKAKASWNGSSFDKGKTGEMKQTNGHRKSGNKERKDRPGAPEHNKSNQKGSVPWEGMKANKKSVWTVTTKPFKEAHFATFPEELIIDCIKAGCPENGIVLDPFMGAGTTALVARKLNRNFIGFELNPEYIKIALKRIHDQLGFFA